MAWSTVAIMFSDDKKKLRRAERLHKKQQKHWEKYQAARKELRELTNGVLP